MSSFEFVALLITIVLAPHASEGRAIAAAVGFGTGYVLAAAIAQLIP